MLRKNCVLFYILIISKFSFGYINISPTSFDKNIGKGAYQEFTLYNNTSIPVRYRIEPQKMSGKDVGDMCEWIEVYPKVITIDPANEKMFKVYIKSKGKTLDGDYGAFLNIKQISAPKLKDKKDLDIGAGMIVMTNLNMGLYGYIGAENLNLEILKPTITKNDNKYYLKTEITNKTNRLGRIKVEAKVDKNRYYPIGEMRIMKNQTLILDNEIKNLKDRNEIKEIVITDTETKKVLNTIKI
ncbi:MAG: hypothetical protein ACRC7F_05085 [Cetobacterium sp.]